MTPKRVGFFGLLGSGNLGNDASFESLLAYLRAAHPDVVLDAMVMGPERFSAEYGIPAVALQWSRRYEKRLGRLAGLPFKIAGKALDAVRTWRWVRSHDAVVIPGMGVLEASLPLRATGVPYSMALLALAGRCAGTDVAYVCVGAGPVRQPAVRALFDLSVRMATYRSYRDQASKDALAARGLDVGADEVYPDLVFGLDAPGAAGRTADPGVVALGVMDYHGGNDDRHRSEAVSRHYRETIAGFTGWLLDNRRRVRIFWGDPADEAVANELVASMRAERPWLEADDLTAKPCASLREVMEEMAVVEAVVATRYHTVLSGLKLSKPTISVGYSTKHESLMADMGLPELSFRAVEVEAGDLVAAFEELTRRSGSIRASLVERNAERGEAVARQFEALSSALGLVPVKMATK